MRGKSSRLVTAGWELSASLGSARGGHTTTLLTSGRVLVVGGEGASGILASAERFDPATNTWVSAGSLAQARKHHTTVVLPTGQVLVVGGQGASGALIGAELYDVATGTWSATGSLAQSRSGATATLLPTGQVLVVGGAGPSGALASAELYDVATGAWSATGSLAQARSGATATLLPSGQVLVAGGEGSTGALASAELYDAATGAWTSALALFQAHALHTATLLPSGKVLVVGGLSASGPLASAELYNPAAGSWTSSTVPWRSIGHSATLLPSGKVLVAGGSDYGALSSAWLYDVATGTWTATGSLAQARASHTATLLPSGKVLVVGGGNNSSYLSSAELYDVATGTWSATGSLAQGRVSHSATLLPSGQVLVVGGTVSSYNGELASAELYDPASGTWTAVSPLSQVRANHTATLLPTGQVLVVGGNLYYNYLTSAELYEPSTGTWTVTAPLARGRSEHTATLLPSGKVLVVGGTGYESIASGEVYDPATHSWVEDTWLLYSRHNHTATLLPSGKVLVAGGSRSGSPYVAPQSELYDPATGTWTESALLEQGRYGHTATLLPSGQVLVLGGGYSSGSMNAEMYDDTGAHPAWRPGIAGVSANGPLTPGTVFTVNGSRLRGISEASGGASHSSATDFPLLTLLDVERGGLAVLPGWGFSSTNVTSRVPMVPAGRYLLSATVNGLSSSTVLDIASAPDSVPPTVTLTSPGEGATVRGPVTLLATALDNLAVTRVEFYVGATLVGTDTAPPFRFAWDPRTVANGAYVLTAKAYDAVQSGTSPGVSVTVDNDLISPTVSISAPEPGATVVGAVTVTVTATDDVGVTRVELYEGSTLLASGTTAPYAYSWNTGMGPNGARTITAKAYDAGGNIAVATVPVVANNDLTPPTVTLTSPGEGATLSGTVAFTATASDPSGISKVVFFVGTTELCTDTTAPYSCSSNIRYVSNGPKVLTAKAYDLLNNVGTSAPVNVSFDNDNTPPTVALTAPAQGAALTGTVTFTATASDAVGVSRVDFYVDYNKVGSDTEAPYSFSYNTRNVSNGHRVLTARAYDAVNNEGTSAQVNVTFQNDLTPPTVTLTAPAQGARVTGNAVLTATASDTSGISRVVFFVDQTQVGTATTAPYALNYNSRSLPNGSRTLTAKAYDTLNNVGTSAAVTVTFDNDLTPPTVTLTAPAYGAIVKGTVTLTATATDNIAVKRVEFYDGTTLVGTDTVSPYSVAWATKAVSNGTHQLYAKAYDAVGQVASHGASVTVDNDVLAPTVFISAPAVGATVVGTVAVTVTATDNLGVNRVEFHEGGSLLSSDTSAPYTYNWNTRTGPNGERTITAKAYDAAGNNAADTVTVVANNDLTPPTVTLTAPGEGATLTGTVAFTATASDEVGVSRVAFFVGTTQVGSDTSAPYSFNYNTRSLPNGARVLTARAYDAVNNVGTSESVNVTFDNDFTPPTVTLTAPGEGETLTGTVVFTATASDELGVSRVAFYVGSTQVGSDSTAPYSYSYNTRSMPNGAKVLTAKAYDAMNNVGTSAPVNATFDNDLIAPATSITSPTGGSTLTGVVQIDATASDDRGTITKVDFYQGAVLLGTATTAPYSWQWDTTKVAIGNSTLKTRAWDAAGNSAYSPTVSVTVAR